MVLAKVTNQSHLSLSGKTMMLYRSLPRAVLLTTAFVCAIVRLQLFLIIDTLNGGDDRLSHGLRGGCARRCRAASRGIRPTVKFSLPMRRARRVVVTAVLLVLIAWTAAEGNKDPIVVGAVYPTAGPQGGPGAGVDE